MDWNWRILSAEVEKIVPGFQDTGLFFFFLDFISRGYFITQMYCSSKPPKWLEDFYEYT